VLVTNKNTDTEAPYGAPTTSPGSGQPVRSAAEAGYSRRTRPEPAFASAPSYTLLTAVALFIGVGLISNISATKAVLLFPGLHLDLGFLQLDGLVTDGAFFLFPLAYVLGDIISEIWGFRTMRRVVAMGFAVQVLASLCFTIAMHLPAPDFYENQDAFSAVVGVVPQFLAAGLVGYVVGELINSYVMVRMKRITGERTLWARMITSTVIGEFFDTLVFCTIAASALGMTIGSGDYWNYTIIGFVWKVLVELLIMPLSYAVIGRIKRSEPSYQESLRRYEAEVAGPA